MSYKKLLVHRCDVYHLGANQDTEAGSYGISVEKFQEETSYPDIPDLIAVPCYFTDKGQSITQNEPNNVIFESFLVHFEKQQDIRLNDKIVWEGVSYILQKPRLIKNRHWEVTAVRRDNL
jgi:hypothetical protein